MTIEVEGKDHLYAVPTAHFLILHPPVPGYSKLARPVASEKRHYTYVVGYRMPKRISVDWKNSGSMVAMDAVLILELYSDLKDLFSLIVKALRNQVVILKKLGP